MSEKPDVGNVVMAALAINMCFCECAQGKDTICKKDAVQLLRKEIGNKAKPEELDKMFNTLDADGSGSLDFQEFMTLVGSVAIMCREMMKE
ncbi:protein S100-A11-like [Periophthalmus magnuspinnatus]|uniref:protein S100-A11-like n=1 Tax=Periophthalmus magnuspinnatus TaxID=409849 RepID=UPI00145BDAF9|nr:protein S100-A11-like [Periophthalmus magnuspinnatus]